MRFRRHPTTQRIVPPPYPAAAARRTHCGHRHGAQCGAQRVACVLRNRMVAAVARCGPYTADRLSQKVPHAAQHQIPRVPAGACRNVNARESHTLLLADPPAYHWVIFICGVLYRPYRLLDVKGRTSYALSDVRRCITDEAHPDHFLGLWPDHCQNKPGETLPDTAGKGRGQRLTKALPGTFCGQLRR